ncbi:Frataxin, mitochondrial-like protein, partial [Drosera capensis]
MKMALLASRKLLLMRRLTGILRARPSSSIVLSSLESSVIPIETSRASGVDICDVSSLQAFAPRRFCSRPSNVGGPAAVDYSSMLEEDEFHKLADSTIHGLLEKLEEYGDHIQIDGFDIDYGNQVLTIRLGDMGTYVLNKQTPNRQLWLSSPVSGPSRFDWDSYAGAWVYRRNKRA